MANGKDLLTHLKKVIELLLSRLGEEGHKLPENGKVIRKAGREIAISASCIERVYTKKCIVA